VPYRRTNQQPQSREDMLEKQVKKVEEKWCLGLYREGRETRKRLAKTIVRERKELK